MHSILPMKYIGFMGYVAPIRIGPSGRTLPSSSQPQQSSDSCQKNLSWWGNWPFKCE